ncbi:helix-hairpin-helix domain-containing protein [Streptomyces scopuliridis]|uniref:helix-hairpin-helix domain-containing protein n=1 Tax=Streptomyces scopuliridis TaxID=452529 RepID=UPI000997B387|nr:helix-hairpin-helix domain-containing protein [Streptomyces scopuliridis]
MALRTRSVTSVTSGPGRALGSDGRARHGRHGRPGGVRTRPRTELPRVGGAGGTTPVLDTMPPAAPDPPPARTDVRRRAEALFAGATSGTGGGNGTVTRGADAAVVSDADRAGRRRAWALSALRERLPLWVQLRCGLEPRTLAALAVVLVVGVILAGHHFWSGRPGTVKAPENVGAEAVIPKAPPETLPSPTPSDRVVVDVSGKVRRPGVLRLPAGSRVADALHAAGGAKPGADLTGLNRARVLMDGEQVLVGGPAPPGAGVGTGAANGAPAAAGPVSLNAATPEQLDTLPGVGPVLAQHIIDYRGRHGGFRSVDELREVNGIGERRFADLQSLVRP